jgi:antitoxin component YwqK of YwqJK toxin-antitoxin module
MRLYLFIFLYFFINGFSFSQVNNPLTILDGEFILYYPNGNIMERGIVKNGLRNGEYINYYEFGQIKNKSFYINGVLNNDWVDYYSNGNVKSKCFYVSGNIMGQ